MKKLSILCASLLLSGCFERNLTSPVTRSTDPPSCTGSSADGLWAGGSGSSADPFIICTPEQFLNLRFASYGGLHFRIDSDLNFAGTVHRVISGFAGHVDGQFHVISHVGLNETSTVGLFGTLGQGAVIERLSVRNSTFQSGRAAGGIVGSGTQVTLRDVSVRSTAVRGVDYVGGVVGICDFCEILRASSDATVYGNSNVGGLIGGYRGTLRDGRAFGSVESVAGYAGGLIGLAVLSEISDGFASGDVIAGTDFVGGLIGSFTTGTIANSGAVGDVTGGAGVGGFAGELWGHTTSRVFARGAVVGTGWVVGGLVGRNEGDILDSYFQGSVSSPAGTFVAGGVAFFGSGNVTRVYASATVSGAAAVGGLVGGSTGTITASYWNSSLYGVDNGLGAPLTAAQMNVAANFVTWNFASVWEMGLVFPALRWE